MPQADKHGTTAPSEPAGEGRPGLLYALVRGVGSIGFGMAVLGLTAAYLAAVSVAEQPLADWLGVPRERVYAWWPLPALCALVVLSMLAATLTRVPLRPACAGAWLSHLGVAAIAVGGGWYAVAGEAGECGSAIEGGEYAPMTHVYLRNTAAVYLAETPGGPWRQLAVPGLDMANLPESDAAGLVRLDVPLAEAPGGTPLRATGVSLAPVPVNCAHGEATHAMLRIERAGEVADVLVGGRRTSERDGYTILFLPHSSPEKLAKVTFAAQSGGRPPGLEGRDMLLLMTGPEIPTPTLIAFGPGLDPGPWKLPRGASAELSPGGRRVRIRAESYARVVAPPHLLLTIGGSPPREHAVPFAAFGRYAPAVPASVDGRPFWLRFSRARRPLPSEVRVVEPERVTFANSSMVKDYLCTLAVDGRREKLSLHEPVQVGRWRWTQGQWVPDADRPERIVFGVRSRPGLWLVWVGCGMVALGLPLAFYVKPLLLRRKEARP